MTPNRCNILVDLAERRCGIAQFLADFRKALTDGIPCLGPIGGIGWLVLADQHRGRLLANCGDDGAFGGERFKLCGLALAVFLQFFQAHRDFACRGCNTDKRLRAHFDRTDLQLPAGSALDAQ